MADTVNHQQPKPQFDIGRVINRTFGAIKNNFVSFFLASLIIMGMPIFLLETAPFAFDFVGGDLFVTLTFLSAAVAFIASIILQGALIFGAIEDFNGRKAPFGECMSVAIRNFLPLLGLAILVFLGTALGFLLLIIPGILLVLGWSVVVPVLIVERPGVIDSISRSWELTEGYKRWILLLMVIFVVLSLIIESLFGGIILAAGGQSSSTMFGVGSSMSSLTITALFSALSQTITTMISATGAAAIYYEIRQIKEGIGADSLAAVFD